MGTGTLRPTHAPATAHTHGVQGQGLDGRAVQAADGEKFRSHLESGEGIGAGGPESKGGPAKAQAPDAARASAPESKAGARPSRRAGDRAPQRRIEDQTQANVPHDGETGHATTSPAKGVGAKSSATANAAGEADNPAASLTAEAATSVNPGSLQSLQPSLQGSVPTGGQAVQNGGQDGGQISEVPASAVTVVADGVTSNNSINVAQEAISAPATERSATDAGKSFAAGDHVAEPPAHASGGVRPAQNQPAPTHLNVLTEGAATQAQGQAPVLLQAQPALHSATLHTDSSGHESVGSTLTAAHAEDARGGAEVSSLDTGLDPAVWSGNAKQLEIGLSSGTHGWLRVRAEMEASGTVAASVVAGSAEDAASLHRVLPALEAYLATKSIAVSSVVVHRAPGAEDGAATHVSASATLAGGTASGTANDGHRGDGQPAERSESATQIDLFAGPVFAGGIAAGVLEHSSAGRSRMPALSGKGGWLNVVV